MPSKGWPDAISEVLQAAIRSGQLPIVLVTSVIMLIVYRLPENQLAKISLVIIEHLKEFELYSYIALLVLSTYCAISTRRIKEEFEYEIKRLKEQPEVE